MLGVYDYMKKLLIVFILFLIPMIVNAKDITKESRILVNNLTYSKLIDNNDNSYITISKDSIIKITSDEDIYGIYIIYELKSIDGRISNYTKEIEIGTNGYLHEYINVDELIGHSKELELTYNADVKIGEIKVLSEGELPDYIEVWNTPCTEADLLLFSTHSDDEHLFFAGLMPTYIAKGACVQIVYFTNHNDNPRRLHEQIHGLYKVGIRNYPVIGFVPDALSYNLEDATKNMSESGYTEDDAIKFEVEMIRRFKPLVVVGHDENGEYSHGQHILNTYVLKKAITLTNDETYDNESKELYGLWDTPKTYLHLYKENQIKMNYDIPLDYFGGKSAYEISKLGYKEHKSQQFTWFTKWLTGIDDKGEGNPINKASEITKYSPCEYGLYRSLVGEDINKDDMFENLTLKKDIVINKEKEDTIDTIEVKDKVFTISDYVIYIYLSIMIITIIIEIKKVMK
jgi:LmbE family N-acetylglucosaminyl deacetylase